MTFGLTFDKVLIIAVIAVILIGPERLPHYASQLAKLVKSLQRLAGDAKERLRDEMGPEFDEVDWKKLDPRQYDPRRIIRDALSEEPETPAGPVRAVPSVTPGHLRSEMKHLHTTGDGDDAAAPPLKKAV